MKSVLALIALIVLGAFAFHVTPEIKNPSKLALDTPVQAQKLETVKDTPKPETPVIQAPEPPKVVEPEPVAVQQSPSAGSNGNIVPCETFRPKLAQYGWDVEVALRVIDAESYGGRDGMCNITAKNPEAHRRADGSVICYGSFGLFQISCHGGEIYDVDQNIAAGWAKYSARKWQPWGVCTRGVVSCY